MRDESLFRGTTLFNQPDLRLVHLMPVTEAAGKTYCYFSPLLPGEFTCFSPGVLSVAGTASLQG